MRDLPGEWPLGRPVRVVPLMSAPLVSGALARAQTALRRALRAVEDLPQQDRDGFGDSAAQRMAHLTVQAADRTEELIDAIEAAQRLAKLPVSHVVPPGAKVGRS